MADKGRSEDDDRIGKTFLWIELGKGGVMHNIEGEGRKQEGRE